MPGPDFQSWLDRVDRTFFEDDLEGYVRACALPFTLVTQTVTTVIETRDRLEAGFVAWRDMLRDADVTQVIREARNVEFLAPDLIAGRYVTNILRGTERVLPPFVSSMTLRRIDGDWRAVAVSSGMSNSEFPIRLPRVEDRRART